MKKQNLVLTAVLMAMSLFAGAQEWLPNDFTPYPTSLEWGNNSDWEEWSYIESSSMFVYLVEDNAVGIKHAYAELITILGNAGLDFSNPDIDNSYLASYIDSKFDYGSLSTSIAVGGSEIIMAWDYEGYRIAVTLKENIRGVFIVNL